MTDFLGQFRTVCNAYAEIFLQLKQAQEDYERNENQIREAAKSKSIELQDLVKRRRVLFDKFQALKRQNRDAGYEMKDITQIMYNYALAGNGDLAHYVSMAKKGLEDMKKPEKTDESSLLFGQSKSPATRKATLNSAKGCYEEINRQLEAIAKKNTELEERIRSKWVTPESKLTINDFTRDRAKMQEIVGEIELLIQQILENVRKIMNIRL